MLSQLRQFTRLQKLKEAVIQSFERLNAQQEMAVHFIPRLRTKLIELDQDERVLARDVIQIVKKRKKRNELQAFVFRAH